MNIIANYSFSNQYILSSNSAVFFYYKIPTDYESINHNT